MAVDGAAVAHMNYDQWKDKMASALQTGSLTMDIRRYGNKGRIMSKSGSVLPLPEIISVVLELMASCF